MGIKDLPRAGSKFGITGAGSLPNKLRTAASSGALSVLTKKNQRAIVDAARKRLSLIRSGGLSKSQITAALSEIKTSGEKLTEARAKTIKEVLKHFGRGAAVKEKKLVMDETSVKASDGSYLTEDQIERNRRRTMARADNFGVKGKRKIYSRQYAGGRDVESFGVYGDAEDLGIKKVKTGFASDPEKGDKSPGQPPSPGPLKGSRPIDI